MSVPVLLCDGLTLHAACLVSVPNALHWQAAVENDEANHAIFREPMSGCEVDVQYSRPVQ